ncbi:hypothetical protein M3I53_30985 [Paraburkholderia sp. CNPSo 3272]|uniref:hypothetical protein n=1 Tax=Paraburkholderia sp. CNPSo 3272 TaxID=2940931 RepID=UPI0020B65FF7|nr:hypothetical protein [Paraburkholderia sp. CNPSo 3272]MCP3727496.1 hypothetical protein [Paraburkholderia sp. CNPSo 3272]
MLLTAEEIARLDSVEPFLRSSARAALPPAMHYEVTSELAQHLQPGLRIRAPDTPARAGDPDTPPFPLNLFVALPLEELRALTDPDDTVRETTIARFGATFAGRLRRAIETQVAQEINFEAGVQSEAGTLAVTIDMA